MDRSADTHYQTMVTDLIARLEIPAADDCVLFLWATIPMLPEALRVMSAWGFAYKSHEVWVKDKAGTGYWVREKHELLLIGIRGSVPAPAMGEQYESVFMAPRGEHSQKPACVYAMIEAMYPTLPRLEMFARRSSQEFPSGWDQWGNEVELSDPTNDGACAAGDQSEIPHGHDPAEGEVEGCEPLEIAESGPGVTEGAF